MTLLTEDTIVALSTPLGKSGIGVVRLSGRDALALTLSISSNPTKSIRDRAPVLTRLVEPSSGETLDHAMVTYFQAPRSYTCEDVVEISCHGSPIVLKEILRLLMNSGARLATPGEFTMRALLRGRIDLLQAEAIHDLIEAQTLFQAKLAQQQALGSLSRRIAPVKEQLVRLISLMEAGIDFAEDDVLPIASTDVQQQLELILSELKDVHDSFALGRIVCSGLTIAIVGKPNVGKSSLFNSLLREDRALVTEVPGTTRDTISEVTQISGIPIRLLDTAGIRKAHDTVEQLGIKRSLQALADADRVLFVLDSSQPLTEQDRDIVTELGEIPFILVLNKIDLAERATLDWDIGGHRVCRVSATQGSGLDALRDAILDTYSKDISEFSEGIITNVRQNQAVTESISALNKSLNSLTSAMPQEVVLLDLYGALRSLGSLTGETTVEDILGHIFSTFCIGK